MDSSQQPNTPPANSLDTPSDDSSMPTPSSGVGTGAITPEGGAGGKPPKKLNPVKKFFKKVNLYLLIFIFIAVIAAAITIVSYLNSKKTPVTPDIASQPLNQDAVDQLSTSDASVGSTGQTLTIQGNAIISGQLLTKGDVNVAGTIKVAKEVVVPQLTVSGKSNLADTQANTMQIAQSLVVQGPITAQNNVDVTGNASFSGPVTMGQLTVSRLIMSGNASLQIPNHISFPGASPARSINNAVLGAGGTASINGSDTSGSININTGSGPVAGCFVNLTFNQRFSSVPRVIISPVGSGAGQTQFYAERTATGFSVCTVNAAPANQVFGYDYFIAQ